MQFKTRQRRKVIINITSLIDVIFMLLLFMFVTSTFLEQPGIKLELPRTRSAVLMEQRDYILSMDKEGGMFLNRQNVTFDNLEEKVKEALPKMKDSALILKADKDVTHGQVVKVMDIVKRSGVKKLIIGTKLEK